MNGTVERPPVDRRHDDEFDALLAKLRAGVDEVRELAREMMEARERERRGEDA